MLEQITQEDFLKHIGETFSLYPGGSDEAIAAELIEVSPLPARAGKDNWGVPDSAKREESFAIVLRTPQEPALGQGMYRVAHEQVGQFEGLFLVPVAADEAGRYYEAIFN